MSSAKAFIASLAGKYLFRQSTVVAVSPLSASFTKVVVDGAGLRGMDLVPGDKVQAFVLEEDLRTLTPVPEGQQLAFYVSMHGTGPLARWGRQVEAGQPLPFFGPRRSIDTRGLSGPVTVFGDETSVALALALKAERVVLEAVDVADTQRVCQAVGLHQAVVIERGTPTTLERLANQLHATHLAVFSGCAPTIQALKRVGRGRWAAERTKAYWAPGKKGLD